MASNISVRVVIPVYNGADTIGDLLTALTHQVDPPLDCEIIVVDNGSTDRTCEVVRSFGAALLEESERGPGAARNRGLVAARGEVIAHLDADVVPTRQWLKKIVEPFNDPETIMVGGATYNYKPETAAQRYMASLPDARLERRIGQSTFPFIASRNMAVRRESALAIGGWATDMPTAEDADFCLRLWRKFRAPICHQPTAIAFHHDRATLAELFHQAFTYGEGLARMYFKYPELGPWSFWNTIQLSWVLMKQALVSRALSLGHSIGLDPANRAELVAIHRAWMQSYWEGFRSMRQDLQRRNALRGNVNA